MKAKKIIIIAITAIAAAMPVMSGVMKLMKGPEVVEKLTAFGVGDYLDYLGIMEILFAGLFVFPKTMKLGFILLSCYFAGAMATDLSHGSSFFNAMIVLVLIWIAAFLRDPGIFLPSAEPKL